jgi:hypothetical protein
MVWQVPVCWWRLCRKITYEPVIMIHELFYCLFFLIADSLYCLDDSHIVLLCQRKYFLPICNFFKAQVITLLNINLYTV